MKADCLALLKSAKVFAQNFAFEVFSITLVSWLWRNNFWRNYIFEGALPVRVIGTSKCFSQFKTDYTETIKLPRLNLMQAAVHMHFRTQSCIFHDIEYKFSNFIHIQMYCGTCVIVHLWHVECKEYKKLSHKWTVISILMWGQWEVNSY